MLRRALQSGVEVAESTTAATAAPSEWDQFAAAVSGEWDGVIATYDRDGEAQQLPEYYVPAVSSLPLAP